MFGRHFTSTISRTPVACRADLKDTDGKKLLSVNEIYVRTLNANGIASSSKIKSNDLDDVVERCFQNREADYAAFLSKLIRGLPSSDVASLFSVISQRYQTGEENPGDAERKILDNGWSRFAEEARERSVDLNALGFLEGALRMAGPIKSNKPSGEFLQFIESANPTLTGWPIWLVSRSFSNEKARSYTYQGNWEQFIQTPGFFGHHLDFMIFNPKAEFYFARALEDDTQKKRANPEAAKTVEPVIQLLRVAETLAVGKALASILGDPPDELTLFFGFRWRGIKDRLLIGWANPEFDAGTNAPSRQDSVTVFAELSATANEQEIVEKTREVTGHLTTAFGGYELGAGFFQAQVSKLLKRR